MQNDKDLPDRLIIIAREAWGNTDFLEFSRGAARLGVKIHFVGYPPQRSTDYTPDICSPSLGVNSLRFSIEAAQICQQLIEKHSNQVCAIHIRYFRFSSFLPIRLRHRTILDIRSGSIRRSAALRFLANCLISFESIFFDKTTVVSNQIAEKLKLRKYQEIPLGAPSRLLLIERKKNSDTNKLRFIYIGTLRQRNIQIFANGFEKFITNEKIDWRLDIFGYGSEAEREGIHNITRRSKTIRFRGVIDRTDLFDTLADADVGVSFVPITPYFDLQPPTKTYEYLLAGLPTIATRTIANKAIIKEGFGWLCDDTEASVIETLAKVRTTFEKQVIDRVGMRDHTWEAIFATRYRSVVLERKFWTDTEKKNF
jgi:glycosyltransferase involved in cell wall biosynthesis